MMISKGYCVYFTIPPVFYSVMPKCDSHFLFGADADIATRVKF